MNLDRDRWIVERILENMPDDEESLALKCNTSREHIASLCTMLQRKRAIRLDRSWDAPRHWKLSGR